MKLLKVFVLVLFAATFLLQIAFTNPVKSQSAAGTEAPTGFDNKTNGFVDQAVSKRSNEFRVLSSRQGV